MRLGSDGDLPDRRMGNHQTGEKHLDKTWALRDLLGAKESIEATGNAWQN